MKAGKGTHGSVSKAGKVRKQTPIIPPSNIKPKDSPRVAKRKLYNKRIVLERNIGQFYSA